MLAAFKFIVININHHSAIFFYSAYRKGHSRNYPISPLLMAHTSKTKRERVKSEDKHLSLCRQLQTKPCHYRPRERTPILDLS